MKILFLDIDGTVLSHSSGSVPASAVLAIRMVQERGIKVYACTGRHTKELQSLPLHDLQPDGWITTNGALNYLNDGTVLSEYPIADEDLHVLYEALVAHPFPVQFLEKEDMYEYLVDMVIAQTYAQFNHKAMAKAIFKDLGENYQAVDTVYSMHNFIDTTDWIIRKGAIRAYQGEKMVIPFNMRDGLLICEGKSNPDWNCSAPHGAGRVLARNKALKTLDMDEFTKEMEGIYSTSVCRQTLDESPMAYKDKDLIMQAIQDTATIIDTIKPIMNIKAL